MSYNVGKKKNLEKQLLQHSKFKIIIRSPLFYSFRVCSRSKNTALLTTVVILSLTIQIHEKLHIVFTTESYTNELTEQHCKGCVLRFSLNSNCMKLHALQMITSVLCETCLFQSNFELMFTETKKC